MTHNFLSEMAKQKFYLDFFTFFVAYFFFSSDIQFQTISRYIMLIFLCCVHQEVEFSLNMGRGGGLMIGGCLMNGRSWVRIQLPLFLSSITVVDLEILNFK